MKDELKNVKIGGGSAVCWQVLGSAFGLVLLRGHRHSLFDGGKFFILTKMDFKGRVTDYSRGSIQGITDNEVEKLVGDLERMVPRQARKCVDWVKEQGTWPTKMLVSMWFKNEVNLVTMIDLLRTVGEEQEKNDCKIDGQNGKARLEVSPQKKILAKGHCTVFKGLKEMKGDESKVSSVVGRDVAANSFREGEGTNNPVVSAICTDFNDALFET